MTDNPEALKPVYITDLQWKMLYEIKTKVSNLAAQPACKILASDLEMWIYNADNRKTGDTRTQEPRAVPTTASELDVANGVKIAESLNKRENFADSKLGMEAWISFGEMINAAIACENWKETAAVAIKELLAAGDEIAALKAEIESLQKHRGEK